MATPAQLAANRANAQKSTGPRTPEGKSRSRMNAYDHGLTAEVVRSEAEQAAFDAYAAPLLADLAPATPVEHDLASLMVNEMWRLQRMSAVEQYMFCHGAMEQNVGPEDSGFDRAIADARTFLSRDKTFNFLSLCEQRLNRSLSRHMEEFRKMKKEAREAGEARKAQPGTLQINQPERKPAQAAAKAMVNRAAGPTESVTSPEIGFVFSDPAQEPAPPPEAFGNAPENMAA